MNDLLTEIKTLIVNALELEDIEPQSIGDDEALFEDGLCLDSIDALELGIALQKSYGIQIEEDDEALQDHFRTPRTLASFVEGSRV